MACAIVCDRCGKFSVEYVEAGCYGEMSEAGGGVLAKELFSSLNAAFTGGAEGADLCLDCARSLLNWWNSGIQAKKRKSPE